MTTLKQFQEEGEKFHEEWVEFVESQVWQGEDEYTKNMAVGNVADWWIDKINKQTSLAYELGKKEMLEKLIPRIGMLRQWLNEERITDKKMVTSEDIKDWLGLSALNEE